MNVKGRGRMSEAEEDHILMSKEEKLSRQERVSRQPSIIVGGTMRDYQIEVYTYIYLYMLHM